MDPRPTPAHPVSLDSANPPEFLAVKSGIRLPQKVFELRDQLNHKAKQEPKFRFYALYDRRYRRDVLLAAWWLVVKNEGAPGVDGVSFESIDDPAPLLEELHELLRTKTYEPLPVLRGKADAPHRQAPGHKAPAAARHRQSRQNSVRDACRAPLTMSPPPAYGQATPNRVGRRSAPPKSPGRD